MILGTSEPAPNLRSTAAKLAYWLPCAAIHPKHGCTTMKRQWTRDELADHWTLAPTEFELLATKSGATRLGFAILLKAFTLEGRFPRQKHGPQSLPHSKSR